MLLLYVNNYIANIIIKITDALQKPWRSVLKIADALQNFTGALQKPRRTTTARLIVLMSSAMCHGLNIF
jgi:hypothetical protein